MWGLYMNSINQSQHLAFYIDRLRQMRNMSTEDFLDGIVSSRQYRRYISGDSTMSYLVLDDLSKRLGFTAENVLMELETEKIKQSQTIMAFYNAVLQKNQKEADRMLLEIDESELILETDLLLYKHGKLVYQHHFKHLQEELLIEETKKLLKYDELLKRQALSQSELHILITLFNYPSFKEPEAIAKKLASYLDDRLLIVTGHNIKIVTLVLEELSRYYSIVENYEKMLYYADEALKYCLKIKSYYLLETIYYFKAAAHHELGMFEERDLALKRLYGLLVSENNQAKLDRYKGLFMKRFNKEVKDLFTDL